MCSSDLNDHLGVQSGSRVRRRGDFIIFYFLNFDLFYLFILAALGLPCCTRGLSLVVMSGGCSSLWCTGFSLRWFLLLRSMGSRHVGISSCGTQVQ